MTQRARVLAMLRRGPTTTQDFLAAFIPRFSARIDELRTAGYVIERNRVSASSFAYRLVAEPGRTCRAAPIPVRPLASLPEAAPRDTLFDATRTPLGAYDEAA